MPLRPLDRPAAPGAGRALAPDLSPAAGKYIGNGIVTGTFCPRGETVRSRLAASPVSSNRTG